MTRIVAQRGDTTFLLVEDDGIDDASIDKMGRIFDSNDRKFSDVLPVQQIIKWGYWLPPDDGVTPESIGAVTRRASEVVAHGRYGKLRQFFSPDQKRDKNGQWTKGNSGGGASDTENSTAKSATNTGAKGTFVSTSHYNTSPEAKEAIAYAVEGESKITRDVKKAFGSVAKTKKATEPQRFFSPTQQRDYHGRFGSGGPPAGSGAKTKVAVPKGPKAKVAVKPAAKKVAPKAVAPKAAEPSILDIKTSNGPARILSIKAGMVEIEYTAGKYKGKRQTAAVISTRLEPTQIREALAKDAAPVAAAPKPVPKPVVAKSVEPAKPAEKPAPEAKKSEPEAEPEPIKAAPHTTPEARTMNALQKAPMPASKDWETFGGEIGTQQQDGQHINHVYRATLKTPEGDTKVIVKPQVGLAEDNWRTGIEPKTDNEREVAAYFISQQLGGIVKVPETVLRETDQGKASVQRFVESDGTIAELMHEDSEWMGENRDKMRQDERRIAIFDAVVGNLDRHSGNALVRKNPPPGEPHLVPIDHGAILPDDTSSNGGVHMFMEQMEEPHSTLTNEELRLVDDFSKNRPAIDRKLKELNIPDSAVTEMWKRVEFMQKKRRAMDNYEFFGKHWDDEDIRGYNENRVLWV